jgi:ubiquinone/menaquinone biosynthesis C-methylase UbiE
MEHKIFNPENMERLNHPDRLNILDPQKIWNFMGVESPSVIIDIGAGTGFMTEALSRNVPDAQISAFDIEPLMVEEMKKRFYGNDNIHARLMEENILPHIDENVDVVWMINLYHEIHKPFKLLREVKRVLKPDGKFLIIDWAKKPEACESGPPFDHRVDEATITSGLVDRDFRNIRATHDFPDHLGIICQK